MADYRQITVGETLPDAPVTSDLMSALADNPVAIAEGASGAPKVQAAALRTYVGGQTALNLDAHRYVLVAAHLLRTAEGAVDVQYRLSSNNGTSWNSWRVFNSEVSAIVSTTTVIDISSFNAIQVAATNATFYSCHILALDSMP